MILGKKETTICKSNCLLYCISSFNFIAYENNNVWYNSPHFQLWDGDGLIWGCLFSGLTKITAPRLLHLALPPFYKCWKLKLKRKERMKRLRTLEVKKLVALIKGEVLWLFPGGNAASICATSEHGTCSTLSFDWINNGQRSNSNRQ